MNISCKTCREQLGALNENQDAVQPAAGAMEDAAGETVQLEMRAHLAECEDCRSEWSLQEAARDELRAFPPLSAPTDLRARIRAQIETAPADTTKADTSRVDAAETAASSAGAASGFAAPSSSTLPSGASQSPQDRAHAEPNQPKPKRPDMFVLEPGSYEVKQKSPAYRLRRWSAELAAIFRKPASLTWASGAILIALCFVALSRTSFQSQSDGDHLPFFSPESALPPETDEALQNTQAQESKSGNVASRPVKPGAKPAAKPNAKVVVPAAPPTAPTAPAPGSRPWWQLPEWALNPSYAPPAQLPPPAAGAAAPDQSGASSAARAPASAPKTAPSVAMPPKPAPPRMAATAPDTRRNDAASPGAPAANAPSASTAAASKPAERAGKSSGGDDESGRARDGAAAMAKRSRAEENRVASSVMNDEAPRTYASPGPGGPAGGGFGGGRAEQATERAMREPAARTPVARNVTARITPPRSLGWAQVSVVLPDGVKFSDGTRAKVLWQGAAAAGEPITLDFNVQAPPGAHSVRLTLQELHRGEAQTVTVSSATVR